MRAIRGISADGLEMVEPQVRLTEREAEAALSVVRGQPLRAARSRLRSGPGRTSEPLARLVDTAITHAEGAGLSVDSWVVVQASARRGEDIVRVRRLGYGPADWITTPVCSVRMLLGPSTTRLWTELESQCDDLPDRAGEPANLSRTDDRVVAIREALSEVIDPDLGVNVVDLGFVRTILIDDRTAALTMTLTSAACPLTAIIEEQIEARLTLLPCVDNFRVDWQWIPAWRPADISADGREQLRSIGFTV